MERLKLLLLALSSSFVIVIGKEPVVAGTVPRFIEEPVASFLYTGSKVILKCTVVDTDIPADIRWLYNGSLLANKRGTSSVVGGQLVVDSKSRWQEGVYQCIANGSSGAMLSRSVSVSRPNLADFDSNLPNRNITVTDGNTAVIPCATPKGIPPIITEFEKNSHSFLLTSRHLTLPSGNLQIANVTPGDDGEYRCVAVNPLTLERRLAPNVIRLKVSGSGNRSQPRFSWTPESHVDVVRGQNLTIECVAEGWPVPKVTWKRYGGELPEGRHEVVWGNLVINNVEKLDEGTYICRAEVNGSQRQENVAFVDVLEPPVVVTPLANKNVTESGRVTFICDVLPLEKVTIEWFFNSIPVATVPTATDQRVIIANNSLTLVNVRPNQMGIYQCFVSNSVGVDYSSAILTVNALDDVNKRQQNDMQDADSHVGEPAIAPSPSPNRRRKKLLKNSSQMQSPVIAVTMMTVSVISSEVTDVDGDEVTSPTESKEPVESGVKENKEPGENGGGGSATLGPPSKPVVTKLTETAVRLRWSVPDRNNSLPIVFFKIQFKEILDSKRGRWRTLDEEINRSSRSYDVFDLKTGSSYQFRIAAVYSNFDNQLGPNSDRFALRAGGGSASSSGASARSRAPVSSPMIVDVQANLSSFFVVWQYQPAERVSIDGFNIFYKPYDSPGAHLKHVVTGANIRKATIHGLLSDTSYSIHMTCFNGDAESKPSISVVRRTLTLFGPSGSPETRRHNDEDDDVIVDADEEEDDAVVAATTLRSVYLTSRNNTQSSNELLFIVLGVVLGVMMLVLVMVMVACACKQRQERRLMAAVEGRRKFHDPSKTIYVGGQMTLNSRNNNGGFLLNGIGGGARGAGGSGNGHLPTSSASQLSLAEYKIKDRGAEESRPLNGRSLSEHGDHDDMDHDNRHHNNDDGDVERLNEDVKSRDREADPLLGGDAHPHQQQPPTPPPALEDHLLPSIPRPKDVPFQQHSLNKSSRSSCDPRRLSNDYCDSHHPASSSSHSPDHIPRLHECQALYRSPEHTRRAHDRGRARNDHASDRSLSLSSQVSSGGRGQGRMVADPIRSKVVGSNPPDETRKTNDESIIDCYERFLTEKESETVDDVKNESETVDDVKNESETLDDIKSESETVDNVKNESETAYGVKNESETTADIENGSEGETVDNVKNESEIMDDNQNESETADDVKNESETNIDDIRNESENIESDKAAVKFENETVHSNSAAEES